MRRAVYPGSFDPVTNGHMDIIQRAAGMFDELIVGILNNKQKSPLFSIEERVKILTEVTKDLPNVRVDSFSGLMADYAVRRDICICVRGIRTVADLEYESQMAQFNRNLSGGRLETIFLTPRPEYSYISSSGVREAAFFQGDITPCVPSLVAEMIREKYTERNSV